MARSPGWCGVPGPTTRDIGLRFGEFQRPGTPGDTPEKLFSHSSLAGVTAVTTPVRFLHGGADLRGLVEQAERPFTALRRLGSLAVLVRYPGEAHALKRPHTGWTGTSDGLPTTGKERGSRHRGTRGEVPSLLPAPVPGKGFLPPSDED